MNKRALKEFSQAGGGGVEVTGVEMLARMKSIIFNFAFQFSILLKGVYSDGDPPLPIPNREVKPVSADGTAFRWESRSMPNLERGRVNVTRPLVSLVFQSYRQPSNLPTCNL